MIALVVTVVTLAIPFVFLTLLAQQYGYDRNIGEASRDLGSKPLGTFLRVVLPLMLPGIIEASFLAITISSNDFVVAFLLTGGTTTLPLFIFGLTKGFMTPAPNALGTMLTAAVVAMILLHLGLPRVVTMMRAHYAAHSS